MKKSHRSRLPFIAPDDTTLVVLWILVITGLLGFAAFLFLGLFR